MALYRGGDCGDGLLQLSSETQLVGSTFSLLLYSFLVEFRLWYLIRACHSQLYFLSPIGLSTVSGYGSQKASRYDDLSQPAPLFSP